jgi:hypothetical protein
MKSDAPASEPSPAEIALADERARRWLHALISRGERASCDDAKTNRPPAGRARCARRRGRRSGEES